MRDKIDLQIQTTASDGKHTPREVVQMAKDEGLGVISITDHDTVDGVEEALRAAEEFAAPSGRGIRVIPGIEISVEEHDAHILGYGIDYKNPELHAELEKSKRGRIEGNKKMVENLKKEGFVIEWEDVLKQATGDIIARPHIVKAIFSRPENKEKLGGISTVHDFIENFLSNESPNFVRRTYTSAQKAISLIHGAGGLAVWSHPAVHFHPVRSQTPSASAVPPEAERTSNGATQTDYEELENFLKELVERGIDGVEVFGPSHTEDDAEFVQSLAVRYNLLRTAGSDFHEKGEHPRNSLGLHSADKLGDYETYGFSIDDVVQKLDEAIAGKSKPRH